ncbi:hypothetical protein Pla123a_38840 [Posidoniimonas polymericola]|uniref:DUF423 domain-containing protein n=1 Tax=Posidoniimonas polymericola TaxID=2528002 RepID=A0A5C5YEW6_9BACT|nr:DUF423 domain-containing protein [Posidoniimonas polymericola]TWT73548.1 hypothetical protein Pla123a_38840 [Posidoniimonas polymericola]
MNWLTTAGIWGAIGIAIGAFGAHGLPTYLGESGYDAAAVAQRLETFHTGAQYHMYAALGLVGVGVAARSVVSGTLQAAGWLQLGGSLIFSGLLYAIALLSDDFRWLGAIVPIGGLTMIGGWVMIAVTGFARRGESPPPMGEG